MIQQQVVEASVISPFRESALVQPLPLGFLMAIEVIDRGPPVGEQLTKQGQQ